MKGKLRKRRIGHTSVKINCRNILLFSLLLCGVIIGSVTVKNSTGTITEIAGAVFENIYGADTRGLINYLSVSLLGNMLYLTASFVFGLCAVGIPMVALIPAVKGVYLGVLCGYLYKTFGVTGIGYSALVICPGAVIAGTLLILACSESVLTNIDLCYLLTRKNTEKDNIMKSYAGRYGILAAGMLAASIIDTVFYAIFAGMFTF